MNDEERITQEIKARQREYNDKDIQFETHKYKQEYETRKRAEQFEKNPNISYKRQGLMDKIKGWKQSYDEHKEKQAVKRVEFLKKDNERLKLENERARILRQQPQRTYNTGFEGSLFGNNPFGGKPVKNTFGADFFSNKPISTAPKKHKHKKVRYVYKKVRV